MELRFTSGIVAQIEYTEWTPDGHLRHSKFVGLRDDKNPDEIMRDKRRFLDCSPNAATLYPGIQAKRNLIQS